MKKKAIRYNSLNDFFESGNTEIWYAKTSAWFLWETKKLSLPKTEKELKETHILLGNIDLINPHEIFHKFQGEYWSSNGEARDLIIARGLNHTSMSVGDIIKFKINNHALIVKSLGFKKFTIARE